MRELKSLLFIPKNAKYLTTLEEIDEFTTAEDLLKKRIKENPYNRDMLRRKLKGKNPSDLREKVRKTKPSVERVIPDRSIPTEVDDGGKNYIKNLTGSPILIITDEISTSGKTKGFPKAIEIKEFKAKNELSEKELNNPQLLNLYAQGKIIDVGLSEYKEGMKKVWEKQNSIISARESAIDADIVDPISHNAPKAKQGGVSRVDGSGDSIVDRLNSGNFYPEESEYTINLSGAERGSSLAQQLSAIENAGNEPLSDQELSSIMRNF